MKVNSSKYIILSLFVALFVAVIFVSARTTRPEINSTSISPTSTTAADTFMGSDFTKFGLKIDKLDVVVPIVKDVDGGNQTTYNRALEGGVAHYKGTSLPGESGNIFIFGHSSTATGQGSYAKIFATLDYLKKGDRIVIFYEDREYNYIVFDKSVVENDNMGVLDQTKNEQLTLMTCWPVGTKAKRLIIKAKLE